MTITINNFGTAPDVAPRHSYRLKREVKGTDAQILKRYRGKDVVIVKSAAVHGEPNKFMFGVFEPIQKPTVQ